MTTEIKKIARAAFVDELEKISFKMVKSVKEPLTKKEIAELAKEMGVDVAFIPIGKAESSLFLPKGTLKKAKKKRKKQLDILQDHFGFKKEEIKKVDKLIDAQSLVLSSPKSPEAIAHEMGHAHYWSKPVVGKLLTVGRKFGPFAGIAAAIPVMLKHKPLMSGLIMATGFAPTLVDEALASLKGYGELRDSGKYSEKELRKMRGNLFSAYGTYLKAPLMIASIGAVGHVADRVTKATLPKSMKAGVPFPKLAARAFTKDFVAGIDPTGTKTFEFGIEDTRQSKKDARLRQMVGVAGGLVGGGLIIPSAISGLVSAIRIGGTKGLKAIPMGFIQGFQRPLMAPIRGTRAIRALKSGNIAPPDAMSIGKLLKAAPTTEAMGSQMIKNPEISAEILKHLPKGMKNSLKKSIKSEVGQAVAALSLSGLIGGGAAFLQYRKGRNYGKQIKRKDH